MCQVSNTAQHIDFIEHKQQHTNQCMITFAV